MCQFNRSLKRVSLSTRQEKKWDKAKFQSQFDSLHYLSVKFLLCLFVMFICFHLWWIKMYKRSQQHLPRPKDRQLQPMTCQPDESWSTAQHYERVTWLWLWQWMTHIYNYSSTGSVWLFWIKNFKCICCRQCSKLRMSFKSMSIKIFSVARIAKLLHRDHKGVV